MNAMPNLDIICKKVVEWYKKIYGDKIFGIYLYGSYACDHSKQIYEFFN